MKIKAIYDDGGKSIDRYSVYYSFIEKIEDGHKFYACRTMNSAPFHPQGFGQWCSGQLGRHNGKRITFEALPDDCRKLVLQDLSEQEEVI